MSGSERQELPASVNTPAPARRPAPCSIAVAAVVPGLLALYLWTASRSLRSPNPYSIGHWLQSYEHGFIKRGRLGSVVRPLLHGRGPEQINDTIELASFLLFAAFSLVMVASATMILWRDRSLAVLVAAVVVLGSPFVVFSAHLVGYFDPLVAALGIASGLPRVREEPPGSAPRRRLLRLTLAVLDSAESSPSMTTTRVVRRECRQCNRHQSQRCRRCIQLSPEHEQPVRTVSTFA